VVPVIKDADKKGVCRSARKWASWPRRPATASWARPTCRAAASPSLAGRHRRHYFTPIINAPEVAILGVSKGQMKPVWDGKQFVPRLMLPLSLTYDHRVIDGAAAARFNAYLGRCWRTSAASCCKGA
jgi:pyruvate dehydrogenase E2 component (dihydrolipoamide acetyltransferase)